MAGGSSQQTDGELDLLHGQLYTARRNRGADRAAGLRNADGGRIPPPPRCILPGAESGSRVPLYGSRRRVLRVRERDGDGDAVQGACGFPVERGGSGLLERREFW